MDIIKTGKFIAEKRKEKGLRQQDLADKLHITDKAVSKWERGLACPDISLLVPLAEALGISVMELLKGERIEELDVNVADAVVIDAVNDYISAFHKKTRISKIKYLISSLIIIVVIISAILSIINYLDQQKYNQQFNFITGEIETYIGDTIVNKKLPLEFRTTTAYHSTITAFKDAERQVKSICDLIEEKDSLYADKPIYIAASNISVNCQKIRLILERDITITDNALILSYEDTELCMYYQQNITAEYYKFIGYAKDYIK